MTVLNAADRQRTERMLPVLEVALDKLTEAYQELLTDRAVFEFGDTGLSGEEYESLQQEPVFRDMARVMDHLERRIRQARLDLADDGSQPPF